MLPIDAAEEVAKQFGRTLDQLFDSGTFGEGIQFLAGFLTLGFQDDRERSDRQLQLFRGKEEAERKIAAMPAGNDIARARAKKLLKQLEDALKNPLDSCTPEQAQAYYVGRIDLLTELVDDLALLADMMKSPDTYVADETEIN